MAAEYGKKGVDTRELVENKRKSAAKNGHELSFRDAYEEVVADSLQLMFTDTKLSEKLAKLKIQDKSLWQKVKDFFADWQKKIAQVYEGLKPQTREAEIVGEMKDSLDRISDMFAEALVDAGDRFGNAELSGDTINNKKQLNSDRQTVQDEVTDKYKNTVKGILNGTINTRDSVLVGYTPELYQNLGMPNLPVVIGSGHIYSIAKTESEAQLDGKYNKNVHYHGLGEVAVGSIYEKLLDPVMIIA